MISSGSAMAYKYKSLGGYGLGGKLDQQSHLEN